MITARASSTRLPEKFKAVLSETAEPLLHRVYARCQLVRELTEVVVVCPDNIVASFCRWYNLEHEMCGPNDRDVTRQLLEAADRRGAKHIALVTGDEPFIDPKIIDESIERYFEFSEGMVYHDYPKGFEVRVLSTELLRKIDNQLKSYREHGLTLIQHGHRLEEETDEWSFVRENRISHELWLAAAHLNYSVDTPEDLAFARKIASMTAWNAPAEEIMKCASEILK